MKESELAFSKTAMTDPPLSRSEDVLAHLTRVVPEVTKSRVSTEAPPMTTPAGVSFEEVAREVLKDAEEVFNEEGFSAMSNPPAALVEDSHLSVEDFLEEG